MLLSIYPTDAPDVRAAVVDQACALDSAPVLFTSLHIPEAGGLAGYIAELNRWHAERGVRFWADVSPATLRTLGLGADDWGQLRTWGCIGLRIDFGFTPEQIRRIASSAELPVAVNASTVSETDLDALADVAPVGWHNFYPRPETGLSEAYFRAQSALFTARGLPVHAFVPGELARRAPLHRGLPTLESQRFGNAYANALALAALVPGVSVVNAEGPLRPQHVAWLREWESSGTVTLPLAELAEGAEFLLERPWTLRPELSGSSRRLEGTRGERDVDALPAAATRAPGAVLADGPGWGRYVGEVHLMTATRPLDGDQVRLGQVAAAYVGVTECLDRVTAVRFVRA